MENFTITRATVNSFTSKEIKFIDENLIPLGYGISDIIIGRPTVDGKKTPWTRRASKAQFITVEIMKENSILLVLDESKNEGERLRHKRGANAMDKSGISKFHYLQRKKVDEIPLDECPF